MPNQNYLVLTEKASSQRVNLPPIQAHCVNGSFAESNEKCWFMQTKGQCTTFGTPVGYKIIQICIVIGYVL